MKSNEDDIFAIAYGSAFSSDTSLIAPYLNYPYYKEGDVIHTDSAFLLNYENGFGNLSVKSANYKENLEKLKAYVIEVGTGDEYAWITKGCIYFDEVLSEKGIYHNYNPFSGNHMNMLSQRINDYMLPLCSNTLEFDTAHFNSGADVYGIKITGQIGDAIVDKVSKTVSATVKTGTDLTKVKPAIYISSGARINPPSNIITDYSGGSVSYTLVSEDQKNTEVWLVSISVQTRSSESYNFKGEFNVYPNPADDRIAINSSYPHINVRLADITGREVMYLENYSPGTGIDISDLIKGIYFLTAAGGENRITVKLSVK